MRNKPVAKKLNRQQRQANNEHAAFRWAEYYRSRPERDLGEKHERQLGILTAIARLPRTGTGHRTAMNDAKRLPGKYNATALAGGVPGKRECARRVVQRSA
jgi:hypothetical protein